MAKKIKISIKDNEKLEFYLEEPGDKGDYICINDLNDVNLDEVKKFFNQLALNEKEQLKSEILNKEKNNIINEFKTSSEYNSLKDENLRLKETKQVEMENLKLSLENKFKDQINALNNQIQSLTLENESKLKEQEMKFEQLKKDHEEEINVIKSRRYEVPTKTLGENFELFLKNEIEQHFNATDYVSIEKANNSIDGTKPDFLFKVSSDDQLKQATIVLEAKTQGETGKTKNSDHYKKLDMDRQKNNGEYAILVTELEPEVNFSILRIKEYENMYICRPNYLNVLLNILTVIIRKELFIKEQFENQQIKFEEKEKIISQFEDLKESINNNLDGVDKKIQEIFKQAESIDKASEKIKDTANSIIQNNKRIIENKINNFNIQAKVKKIENLEE